MSKVYEAQQQMDELAQDNGWQEWQEQQEAMAQAENYGMDNMEPNKAEEFAKRIIEEAS